jgi:hypothetical protein
VANYIHVVIFEVDHKAKEARTLPLPSVLLLPCLGLGPGQGELRGPTEDSV